jgi:hypothetical protein
MGRGATGCSNAERTLEQNDPSIDPSIAGSVRCHVLALCGMGAPLGEMVNARSKSETCATPGGSSSSRIESFRTILATVRGEFKFVIREHLRKFPVVTFFFNATMSLEWSAC